MKYAVPCMKCVFNEVQNYDYNFIEMNDSGFYKFECSQGHENALVLQDEKFEILFDLGALALIDGYAREAVSSFAASIERFYEFFINVIVHKEGIDPEEFKKTWKNVKNQSERQLGAFYFLYLTVYKEVPPIIKPKLVEFRNNVIHKGYIPTYEETYNYGLEIYNYIKKLLILLRVDYKEEIMMVDVRRRMAIQSQNTSVTSLSHMFQMVLADHLFNERTFEDAFTELADKPGLYRR
ncbi:hypothetical protein [Rossellomorea sp. RS05]|uniref:hypothetical protein n=1 Tax=Rossellomorea sp. RS05 TaxID=3149166 RepID=UPI003221E02E